MLPSDTSVGKEVSMYERCPNGHEFAPANTYVHNGCRYCRECRRIRNRERQRRLRELARRAREMGEL